MKNHKSIFFFSYLILIFSALFTACDSNDITLPEQSQNRSIKRGVSYSFQIPTDDANLMGKGISWFYNWGPNITESVNTPTTANKIDYIPMAWNGNFNANAIRTFKTLHPECKYLLAYNEPNLTDQANMTPVQAAANWPLLKALATELNLKIVSPAMNYGTLAGYGDPIVWLDEFFLLIPESDIDVIAVHCYMANASALAWYLNRFKKYNKPIWLTEFCAWESSIKSVNDQMKYMSDAVNYLEANSMVERYAWFIPRANGSVESYPYMQLLTKTTPYALSELGKVYIHMSTQDKSIYYPQNQKIPAEHYSSLNTTETVSDGLFTNSVRIRPTTDVDGELEIYDFMVGYWVEYQIETTSENKQQVLFRYSATDASTAQILIDGETLATCNLKTTGASTNWETQQTPINITKGKHTMRIYISQGNIALNWLQIIKN